MNDYMIKLNSVFKLFLNNRRTDKSDQYIIDHWHEEVGELMVAINKYKRSPNDDTLLNIKQEIGDVILRTFEIADIYGSDDVHKYLEEKVNNKISQKKK